MPAPAPTPDPAAPDLYWAGHSGWAAIPGVITGAIASVVVMMVGPWIGDQLRFPRDWTTFVLFWITLGCWAVAGLIWSYRSASYVYRLTPRRLYLDFGMLYRPIAPIELARITRLEIRAWTLRRWCGVGAIVVVSKGRPAVRLRGIFCPQRFADAIEAARSAASADGPGRHGACNHPSP